MTDWSVTESMIATALNDPARRRAPDERPHQILDAALAVFGEQGLAGARLEDIAKRAGIAKGTIYLYFPNKEELFREVVRHTIGDRLQTARDALGNAPPDVSTVELLRHFMVRWWAFLCTPEYQTVYRMVIGELHRFPEMLAFYAKEAVLPARELLGQLIDRGIAAGDFRPVDPKIAARILASMFIPHSLWVANQSACFALGQFEPDAVFEQLFDFAIHALRPTTAGSSESATDDAAARPLA
jgi:AcrR family transcriptional regulator